MPRPSDHTPSPTDPAAAPRHHAGRVIGTAALAGALVGAAVAYRRAGAARETADRAQVGLGAVEDLGWGATEVPEGTRVPTLDGASLAVWDVGSGPTVVLPHCWGCSHAVWLPVGRRLVESGHRVVLYDQRGHAASTRGTAPLDLVTLAQDLALVLERQDVTDAVLAGHSMGGMTIMALATHQPEVLARRGRAVVLVATAASPARRSQAQAELAAARLIGSPLLSRTLRTRQGHRLVRGVFGADPVRAQMDLTRTLFADCDPTVRAGFVPALAGVNLLEGIATMTVPTTVLVGSRDRLTPPALAQRMVDAVPGSHLVTLAGRGHMLPLEDPDAVTDEIIRAVKG